MRLYTPIRSKTLHGRHRVMVSRACVPALARWRDPFWLKRGVILDTAHRRKVVMTDASNKGWGALCEGKPTFGLWSEEESGLHINCLEMLAVCQACQFFLPDILEHHVLIRSDSRSVVSYINHQGGLVSKRLCMLANKLLVWAQNNLPPKSTLTAQSFLQGAQMPWPTNGPAFRSMLSPPSRSATADTQSSQGTVAQADSNSPPLEEPTVGVGGIPAAESSPVADTLETGPPLSSERHDMASTARVMGPACVAARREPFFLPERVLNTMLEARASSTRRLYALK